MSSCQCSQTRSPRARRSPLDIGVGVDEVAGAGVLRKTSAPSGCVASGCERSVSPAPSSPQCMIAGDRARSRCRRSVPLAASPCSARPGTRAGARVRACRVARQSGRLRQRGEPREQRRAVIGREILDVRGTTDAGELERQQRQHRRQRRDRCRARYPAAFTIAGRSSATRSGTHSRWPACLVSTRSSPCRVDHAGLRRCSLRSAPRNCSGRRHSRSSPSSAITSAIPVRFNAIPSRASTRAISSIE